MQRGNPPGTCTSCVHIKGTSSQPSCRAAIAGNSALRSLVRVKIALATSSLWMSLSRIIRASSRRVSFSISSLVLAVTVVAPRTPRQCINDHSLLLEVIVGLSVLKFFRLLDTNSLTVFPLKVNDMSVAESDSFRGGIEGENGAEKKNRKKRSDPVDLDRARVIIGLLLLRVRPNAVLIFDN